MSGPPAGSARRAAARRSTDRDSRRPLRGSSRPPGRVMISTRTCPAPCCRCERVARMRTTWICFFGGSSPPSKPLTRNSAPTPASASITSASSSGSSGSWSISSAAASRPGRPPWAAERLGRGPRRPARRIRRWRGSRWLGRLSGVDRDFHGGGFEPGQLDDQPVVAWRDVERPRRQHRSPGRAAAAGIGAGAREHDGGARQAAALAVPGDDDQVSGRFPGVLLGRRCAGAAAARPWRA